MLLAKHVRNGKLQQVNKTSSVYTTFSRIFSCVCVVPDSDDSYRRCPVKTTNSVNRVIRRKWSGRINKSQVWWPRELILQPAIRHT